MDFFESQVAQETSDNVFETLALEDGLAREVLFN